MLQCVAVCCSVLLCVAVCCSVSQYVAVCCSALQCHTWGLRQDWWDIHVDNTDSSRENSQVRDCSQLGYSATLESSQHVTLLDCWLPASNTSHDLDYFYYFSFAENYLFYRISFAENCLFYRALVQKRPVILRSLLIVGTLYLRARLGMTSPSENKQYEASTPQHRLNFSKVCM